MLVQLRRSEECFAQYLQVACNVVHGTVQGWLYAQILLLGVGYDKCTAFHLAEYRLSPQLVENRINYNGLLEQELVLGTNSPRWSPPISP